MSAFPSRFPNRWQAAAPGGTLLSYLPLGLRSVGNVNANRTLHNLFALEADFDLVRVAFVNDTASAFTMSTVTAAAVGSENVAGNYAPIDAAGNAVAWTNITFDSGGTPAAPLLGTTGTTRAISVPAAVANAGDGQQVVHGIVWSDWARIASIPPADGSRFRYLAVRAFNSAGAASRGVNAGGSAWTPAAQGRLVTSVIASNDQTAAGAMTAPNATGGNVAIAAIQTYSRTRGVTIMAVGDSITQGINSTNDTNAWGHIARCLLSTTSLPVTWVNLGHGGSTTENFYRRAIAHLSVIQPHIAVYAVWSPNDTQDTANANLAWSRAMEFVGRCHAIGTFPILFGPMRWYPNVGDAAKETVRQAILARCLAAEAARDIAVLNPDRLLGLAGSTKNADLAYVGSSSDYHPNDAGHAVLGADLARILRPLIR